MPEISLPDYGPESGSLNQETKETLGWMNPQQVSDHHPEMQRRILTPAEEALGRREMLFPRNARESQLQQPNISKIRSLCRTMVMATVASFATLGISKIYENKTLANVTSSRPVPNEDSILEQFTQESQRELLKLKEIIVDLDTTPIQIPKEIRAKIDDLKKNYFLTKKKIESSPELLLSYKTELQVLKVNAVEVALQVNHCAEITDKLHQVVRF